MIGWAIDDLQAQFRLWSSECQPRIRYERGSIILTSNKGFGEWGELLGDTVIASAVLDRLLHHSHVLNIPANRSEVKATGSERNARRGYSRRNNTSPRRRRRPATTTPTDQIAEQNPGGSILDRRSWVTSPST